MIHIWMGPDYRPGARAGAFIREWNLRLPRGGALRLVQPLRWGDPWGASVWDRATHQIARWRYPALG